MTSVRSTAVAHTLVDTDAYDVVRIPRGLLRRHEAMFHKRSRIRSMQLTLGEDDTVAIAELDASASPSVLHRVAASAAGSGCASVSAVLRAYLLSDDTRMPRHGLFSTVAADPEDYETYVGEDVWTTRSRTETSDEATTVSPSRTDNSDATPAGGAGGQSPLRSTPPSGAAADVLVLWMQCALQRFHNGVVLCGQCSVASDCDWAVSSRGLVLSNARDIMTAMRMSSVFLEDLASQDRQGHQSLVMSLEEAVSFSGASEFRIFGALPPIAPRHGGGDHANERTAAAATAKGVVLLAGAQRITDVCFPEIASWTPQEEDAAFEEMSNRILCNGGTAAGVGLAETITESLHAAAAHGVVARSSGVLVAYDVAYDSPSLPVYVLSAKVLVPRDGRVGANGDDDNAADTRQHEDAVGGQSVFCLFRDGHAFYAVCNGPLMGDGAHNTPETVDSRVQQQQHRSRRLYVAHDMSDLCAAPRHGHLPLDLLEGDLAALAAGGGRAPPPGVLEMLAELQPK